MAAPTDWYVDPVNGSDSNGGTSLVDAWLTLNYAFTTIAAAEGTDGDRINLRNNATHTLTASIALSTYASANSVPFAVRGFTDAIGDGGLAIIDGASTYSITDTASAKTYLNFQDLKIQNCVAYSSQYLINTTVTNFVNVWFHSNTGSIVGSQLYFTDCKFTGNSGYSTNGVVNCTSSNAKLIRCYFSDNTNICILDSSVSLYVSDCVFNTNGYLGVYCSGTSIFQFDNCSFFDSTASTASGLEFSRSAVSCSVIGCVFEGYSGSGGAGINAAASGTRVVTFGTIYNNSFYNCDTNVLNLNDEVAIYTGNETLGSSPFAKSGSATDWTNAATYYAPQDVGSVITTDDFGHVRGAIAQAQAAGEPADPTWEDSETRDRKCAIAIQSSKVSGNLTDYELTFTEANLPAEIWTLAQNGGGDVRFAYDGVQIPCDIISFDTSGETAEINILVPSVSASANTTVYCYYSTSGTSSQPAASHAYGAENAYRSTNKMTLTLNEDPTVSAPQFIDRTSNSYDATSNGSQISGDSVAGKVGNALNFDGTDDYLTTNVGAALKAVGTGDYCVLGWINRTTTNRDDVFNLKSSDGSDDVGFLVLDTDKVYSYIQFNGGGYNNAQSTGTVAVGSWQQIGTRRLSGTLAAILNGSTAGTTYSSSEDLSAHDGTDAVWIGSNHSAYSPSSLNTEGEIDDLRVYAGAISDDFISARYENVNNPSAFAVAGTPADVSAGGGSGAIIRRPRMVGA